MSIAHTADAKLFSMHWSTPLMADIPDRSLFAACGDENSKGDTTGTWTFDI
jgi:hypothetical protein